MTYHDEHDPELHPDEDTYHPSNLAQALGGAIVTTVIILALYGGASILQGAIR